jgi:diacylglycerol kinase (ATP)
MQATLVYNPNAGGTVSIDAEALQVALRQEGYDPIHITTENEGDLDDALREAQGIIIVAGGDGTARAVATRLIGRNLPLSFLPMGTANNIARTLGIWQSPLEVIAGLANPTRCYFDVGVVHSPWGVDYFLEAFGYGFFADTLATYDPLSGKSVLRGVSAAASTLSDYRPHYCEMKLDGADVSGDYLMVEVLNTTAFGPRLKFAPNADPSDGMLDVIRIREEARNDLLRFVMSLISENLEQLPCVEVNRGRQLEIAWTGFPYHVDGEVRPVFSSHNGNQANGRQALENGEPLTNPFITVGIIPKALEIWLPAATEAE